MASFRVLVTGSRTWTNTDAIKEAFDQAELCNAFGFPMVLVHGGAAGADTLAHFHARRRGWTIETHPAKWETHTDQCPDWHHDLPRCRMAGHRRNAEMVDSGVDICLAFIKDNSRGATACLKLAQGRYVPSYVWRENSVQDH